MQATPEEAARVAADLNAAAYEQQGDRRAAQNLYTAAATIEMIYKIGAFAEEPTR